MMPQADGNHAMTRGELFHLGWALVHKYTQLIEFIMFIHCAQKNATC
jgi:hypothetical protein